jgi:hypothetical protein
MNKNAIREWLEFYEKKKVMNNVQDKLEGSEDGKYKRKKTAYGFILKKTLYKNMSYAR